MHRKAYLGYDLTCVDPERIEDAELTLRFTPTYWRGLSIVPETRQPASQLAPAALDSSLPSCKGPLFLSSWVKQAAAIAEPAGDS